MLLPCYHSFIVFSFYLTPWILSLFYINLIDKSGAWFAYKGEKIGQGKENVKLLLKENVKLKEELEEKIREHYSIKHDVKK